MYIYESTASYTGYADVDLTLESLIGKIPTSNLYWENFSLEISCGFPQFLRVCANIGAGLGHSLNAFQFISALNFTVLDSGMHF